MSPATEATISKVIWSAATATRHGCAAWRAIWGALHVNPVYAPAFSILTTRTDNPCLGQARAAPAHPSGSTLIIIDHLSQQAEPARTAVEDHTS
jgi:hypothetical protein